MASVMPRGEKMRIVAALLCLSVLISWQAAVYAKDYCPAMPKSENEGDPWYIPESAFTKEAANRALKNLSDEVNGGVKGRDFLVNNDLKMVKGYLYRAYLEEHRRAFGKDDEILLEDFCQFIREEAYVEH
jgi:hypothetical protein